MQRSYQWAQCARAAQWANHLECTGDVVALLCAELLSSEGSDSGGDKGGHTLGRQRMLGRSSPEGENMRDGCRRGEVVAGAAGEDRAKCVRTVQAIRGHDERVPWLDDTPAKRWAAEELRPAVRRTGIPNCDFGNASSSGLLPSHRHPQLLATQRAAFRIRIIRVQRRAVCNGLHEPQRMSGNVVVCGQCAQHVVARVERCVAGLLLLLPSEVETCHEMETAIVGVDPLHQCRSGAVVDDGQLLGTWEIGVAMQQQQFVPGQRTTNRTRILLGCVEAAAVRDEGFMQRFLLLGGELLHWGHMGSAAESGER